MRRLGEEMGEKRLVVPNRHGNWEVRVPGAHKPVSQHESLEEAERVALEIVEKAGGGEVMTLV